MEQSPPETCGVRKLTLVPNLVPQKPFAWYYGLLVCCYEWVLFLCCLFFKKLSAAVSENPFPLLLCDGNF